MNTALTFGKWRGLAQIADDHGRFKMLAVDQRPPLQKLVAAAKQKADARDVAAIKRALVAELSPQASAVLMDPIYALPGGANYLAPHCGLIVTLEDHRFSDTDGGRVSRVIPNWSVEKIKRMGGDAVKILVWYHPHAAAKVRDAQQDFVRAVAAECRRLDILLVLELLLYPLGGDVGYVESPQKRPTLVLQSIRDLPPRSSASMFSSWNRHCLPRRLRSRGETARKHGRREDGLKKCTRQRDARGWCFLPVRLQNHLCA